MKEKVLAEKIAALGGRLYIVGGWIRNKLAGLPPKDKDYLVVGIDEKIWEEQFPEAQKVGKSFPVYLMIVDDKKCEIAMARKEKKIAGGYKGFETESHADITLEEDLYRRDTKVNSIAYDVLTGEVIDPFQGQKDIEAKLLSPVSEHFTEDPLRTLRIARQSCELNFAISDAAYPYMEATRDELLQEPKERIFNEMVRALHTDKPGNFFENLNKAKVLDVIFPEIFKLQGKIQPAAFHPEGDAYAHTILTVNEVAKLTASTMARFCGLVHDLGKGLTPAAMLPHHYGHEKVGLKVLEDWNKRMTIPKKWLKAGEFVIESHMKAARLNKTGKILDLLLDIKKSPLTIEEYCAIIKVDSRELPWYLSEYDDIMSELGKVDMKKLPEGLKGAQIGDWIREQQLIILNKYRADRDKKAKKSDRNE